MNTTPLLEVRSVSKAFPGVKALDNVSMTLAAGEVLALVGENGAGKSTLMKILAGIYQADSGQILLEGKPCKLGTVPEALRQGISLIHQELNLAETLSVAANLFLGRESLWGGWFGVLRQRAMNREARERLLRFGLDCDPRTIISELTTGQQQMVEIARALAMKARILIMDEPTSSLTQRESERLFDVIQRLRHEGVAIVYISHRLGEVERLADRVVVLRDGRNAGELSRLETNHANLVRLMVGRDLQQFFHKPPISPPTTGTPRFEIRDLRYFKGPTTPVSFAIYPGEIVGVAGLVGAGRTELAEAVYGIRKVTSGQIFMDGKPMYLKTPACAINAGIAMVPEDRRYHGLILTDSIQSNIGLPNLDRLSLLRTVVAFPREKALATKASQQLGVRTPSIQQQVGLLSGGNQQKVVLGKWLARKPRLLILDEPTRGIDVGAKSEIYDLMGKLAAEGMAIWMISSDLEEVINMSDRVMVVHQGRLAGTLKRSQLTEQAIMHLATGGQAES